MSGLPSTVHADGTGTIVSPCEPRVRVRTEDTGTDRRSATKLVNRAVSSMPAWPMTRCEGKPETLAASAVISSSGLETTMSTASGACLTTFSTTLRTILALTSIRSIRLMPGLRGRPAVMMTIADPATASYPSPAWPVVCPVTLVSNPSTGLDWFMSSARPSGFPSMMSVRTTSSKTSYSASRCAVVEP